MSACAHIDALMIDWLYDELDESMSREFDQHLAGCVRCRHELESLQHTREVVRELPELEPPASLTAILLHEAAKRAPAKRVVAVAADDDRPGLFAWLASWFAPLLRHPAAAAVATLVLVAGVAGSLYLREVKVTEPRATSAAPPPTSVELPGSAAASPSRADTAGRFQNDDGEDQDGYTVQLADEGELDLQDPSGSASGVAATSPGRTLMEKAPPEAKKSAEHLELARDRKNSKVQKADLAFDGSLANAVSGADELVDFEEANLGTTSVHRDLEASGEVLGGTAVVGNAESRDGSAKPVAGPKATDKKKTADATVVSQTTLANQRKENVAAPQAAPQPEPAQQAYRAPVDPKRELEWAQTESRKLAEALRSQRCRDAAAIANDILDRNPDYYSQKIERSKEIKKCQWYVGEERDRRSRQRSKARSKKAAPASPMEADLAAE